MVTVAQTTARMFKCLITYILVFTRTCSPHRTIFENSKPVKLLHTIDIQYTEVFEALVSLDSNKAMGINRISPKTLKTYATSLCEPIQFFTFSVFGLVISPRNGVHIVLLLFTSLEIRLL